MNGIRKLLCILSAFALVALASASWADPLNKHFRLDMVPGAINSAQQDTTFVANLGNDNPSGSSAQFGSFVISVSNVSGITIVSADPDLDFGLNQSVVVSGSSVAVSNLKPNVLATQTYSLTLHLKGCGDGNAASAIVYTGTNLTGATYTDDQKGNETMNVPCGVVACVVPPGTLLGSQINANGVSGYRDVYNKDGSTCRSVDYFVTNLLSPVGGFEHVRWDTQDSAAFVYTVSGPVLHNLAWLTDNGLPTGNPVFVPGQQCDQNNPGLPGPYGTLLSDNGGKKITVDTSTAFYALPATPFPIVIETERLLVTNVTNGGWSVTRGQGGTTAKKHPAGAFVMSTPLPLLAGPLTPAQSAAGYVVGNQAQMCFLGTDSSSGIIDIGDGWGNQ